MQRPSVATFRAGVRRFRLALGGLVCSIIWVHRYEPINEEWPGVLRCTRCGTTTVEM